MEMMLLPAASRRRLNSDRAKSTCLHRGLSFPGTDDERRRAVVTACARARSVKPRHGFAFGNVREVKDACADYGLKIRVIHEPDKSNPNPAYTAIRNYRSDDIELLELLATDAWSEVVEAKFYL